MADLLELIKVVVASGLVGFATSNFFFSFFFSSMLSMIWGAINTLQVIMYTVLFSIAMPVNCYEVLLSIMEVTNLDLFDSRKILGKVITLNDLPAFSYLYEAAGYDSTSFILELGPLALIILFGLVFWILRAIVRLLFKACYGAEPTDGQSNFCSRYLRADFSARTSILRFLLEGCYELGICAMICITTVSNLLSNDCLY